MGLWRQCTERSRTELGRGRMKVLLPAILSGVASRKDRSYTLKFETRELSGESASKLLDYLQQEGYLLFSPNNDITEADVPEEKADAMLGKKTPSQRFRDRLFVYYIEVKQGDKTKFNQWYADHLEWLGEKYLEKID